MPNVIRSCLLLLLLILLGGCAVRPPVGVADPDRYPQDARLYLQENTAEARLVTPETQAGLDADYDKRFFAPWELRGASLPASEAFRWATDFGSRQGYAENLQPITRERRQKLLGELQQESYPSLARPAITVRNTACRIFPTARPFFLDPRLAGEGFPFDHLQHSALWAGTPLLVTHVSRDGAWYFAESGSVAGWLPALDIAWTDEAFRMAYRTGTYAALLADDVTLRSDSGDFLTQTHLGAIFPVAGQTEAGPELLVPVRDADGAARLRSARLPSELAAVKPLPLQPARIAELANRMIGQLYGWGGLYENRDCSATTRDLFAPFGLWLPRNSEAQARGPGTFYDLAGLGWQEKRDRLLRLGVPFYTLVWLKGHIGLYLGTDPASGEPMLLHNPWGVKTTDRAGREGRALIGRLVITSLHPGEEREDVEYRRFYDLILGVTVLPGVESK